MYTYPLLSSTLPKCSVIKFPNTDTYIDLSHGFVCFQCKPLWITCITPYSWTCVINVYMIYRYMTTHVRPIYIHIITSNSMLKGYLFQRILSWLVFVWQFQLLWKTVLDDDYWESQTHGVSHRMRTLS